MTNLALPTRRVFIIHGWGLSSDSAWIPWAKRKLESGGFRVYTPDMPDSGHPKIKAWVSSLAKIIDCPDSDTILVGHSIGGQTILRYLANLSLDLRVGPVIFIAPWLTLKPAATPTKEDQKIARPWLTTPIDFFRVKPQASSFTAIFSDNDPYVSYEENSVAFKRHLGAKAILVKGQGHFDDDSGVTQLPVLLGVISKL